VRQLSPRARKSDVDWRATTVIGWVGEASANAAGVIAMEKVFAAPGLGVAVGAETTGSATTPGTTTATIERVRRRRRTNVTPGTEVVKEEFYATQAWFALDRGQFA
jgi:hypothetical protein